MADPNADNAALAVDELKRKARRRLIGAIVLALAAATLLPLLLEQEQKPLGDDVSVQIPPVDEGRFISRLTGGKGKDAPPEPKAGARADGKIDAGPEPKADAKSEPKADSKPEPRTDAKSEPKADSKPEPRADAKSEPKADSKPEPRADAKSEPKADSKPEPRADAKSEPKADLKSDLKPNARPEPAPAAADANSAPAVTNFAPTDAKAATTPVAGAATAEAERPKAEGFVVQLGAFTDTYGANALSNKLKKTGYPAYTEPIDTSRGTLWRVRVGGYPSRAAANEARDRLKADGHNGIVSAAK